MDLNRLVALVERLRAPDGCPWDREQTIFDVRAYLLEEAHEAAAAIDSIGSTSRLSASTADWTDLEEELGDLLFQIAFSIRLAQEEGLFDTEAVVARIERKMIERHPHVFEPASPRGASEKSGDASGSETSEPLKTSDAVRQAWERRKLASRESEAADRSLLAGVTSSLPALAAAYRMSQKAAGVGFDWPDVDSVFAKIDEELGELRAALADRGVRPRKPRRGRPGDEAVREEVGDLLFTVANLARKLDIDPEGALAESNLKFRRRFRHIETSLAKDGRDLNTSDLAEMEDLWNEAKANERND